MHFQFLVEDQSGKVLINELMRKIEERNDNITHDCKAFRGIGGFTKKNTVKETRTGKLLNDLATYLRGFNKSLQKFPSAIFVILDNDNNDTESFKVQLEQVAVDNNIIIDHVFCVAIEEVEAWLLGDEFALFAAYPRAKQQGFHAYVQDSICGTWETLANIVYPGGLSRLEKDCVSYTEIGKIKAEWARKIGIYMDLDSNKSPSFNFLIREICLRVNQAT